FSSCWLKKNLSATVQDGLKNAPPIFENLGPLPSCRKGQEAGSVYGLWYALSTECGYIQKTSGAVWHGWG
ncbi:MAG: hypothetical protein ACPHRA_09685, partial [Limisphaerales bacterium]